MLLNFFSVGSRKDDLNWAVTRAYNKHLKTNPTFFFLHPPIFSNVLHIPALVQWTCGGHRCELSHLCTQWPGACHLGSTPCRRPEYNPQEKTRKRKKKAKRKSWCIHLSMCRQTNIYPNPYVFYSTIFIEAWILVTHLVLVSSEHFDLILAVQVPQSDCEIVGWRHQQAAGQRVELDGVNLLRVAYEGSQQLSINLTLIVTIISFFCLLHETIHNDALSVFIPARLCAAWIVVCPDTADFTKWALSYLARWTQAQSGSLSGLPLVPATPGSLHRHQLAQRQTHQITLTHLSGQTISSQYNIHPQMLTSLQHMCSLTHSKPVCVKGVPREVDHIYRVLDGGQGCVR